MATAFKSNLYALNQGLSTYSYAGPYGTHAGEIVGVNGTASIPGAITSSDTLDLFPLPIGAHLLGYFHWWEDLGGTMTGVVQVGTTDMKAGITMGTAQAITAATSLSTDELTDAWDANSSAEKTANLTFSTATTPTAGALYYFHAFYIMPSE